MTASFQFTIYNLQFTSKSQNYIYNDLSAKQTQSMKIENCEMIIAIDGREIA